MFSKLTTGMFVPVVVQGGSSMGSTDPHVSVCFAVSPDNTGVGIGDVIAYRTGERILCHRIVGYVEKGKFCHIRKMSKSGYKVKGDNNRYPDQAITEPATKGDIIFVVTDKLFEIPVSEKLQNDFYDLGESVCDYHMLEETVISLYRF